MREKIGMLNKVSEAVRAETILIIEDNVIKRMQIANNADFQALFWLLIESLNLPSERVIELIFRFHKTLDRKGDKFKLLVDNLVSSTNRSIGSLVLTTKYNIKGSLSNKMLAELESKS